MKLQLRFATKRTECSNPSSVLDHGGYRCSWCGFAAMYGMRAYVDDDGDRIACSVCDAVRHAGMLDRDRFRPIWAPEITQFQLSHLGRCIVYAKTLLADASGQPRNSPHPNPPTVDPRFFRELVARGDALDIACRNALDGLPEEVAESLPMAERGTMRDGMRILPVAFPESEIRGWMDDESSLNGLGLSLLDENDWYVHLVGLTSIGIPSIMSEAR
jgi:hypothetical protein